MQRVLSIASRRHFELAFPVAVDAANVPAVKLYRRCGLCQPSQQRVAMIKRLFEPRNLRLPGAAARTTHGAGPTIGSGEAPVNQGDHPYLGRHYPLRLRLEVINNQRAAM